MPLDDSERRDKEIAPTRNSKKHADLVEDFYRITRGFQDQAKRSDSIIDYWDIYNCKLNNWQCYQGNAALYVPIVRNAVMALKTRMLNQLFPASGRYVDAASMDASVPHAEIALLEHYVEASHLKTEIIAALIRNGWIEGQYNLYVDWDRHERFAVSREIRRPDIQLPGIPHPLDEVGDEEEGVADMRASVIVDQMPDFEVLHDTDILVLPTTSKNIDHALRQGGSVTIIRRWTRGTLERMIETKEVMRRPAEILLNEQQSRQQQAFRDASKENIDAAGIKQEGKFIQVYETWKVLDTSQGHRLCRIYYGGGDNILSARRNPYWSDRCPLLSVPIEKVSGSFKGQSPITAVDTLQYNANDIANEAADSATYSMLPIIMTDPSKNPRTSTMLLNLAAIWEIDPNSTRFAEFPKLWQDGIGIIQNITAQIFQTLNVNPAMLPQQTGRPGAKRNQAEIAMEQQVDVLTNMEAASVVEEGILTPSLNHMVELDHQFRDDEITVRQFGELGKIAQMEKVPLIQIGNRYEFTWNGVQQARNAAQQQQQIALLNVAMSPAMQQALSKAGYTLNPAPALEHAFGNIFGWRQGRQILIDARSQLGMDPEEENVMLSENMSPMVHPMDDDPKHIQVHMQLLKETGDPFGNIKLHLTAHQMQMQAKAQAAAMQQMQQQMGGQPQGGGGPTPPMQGGTASGPRLVRGPAGAIHPDQMPAAGATTMPRRM